MQALADIWPALASLGVVIAMFVLFVRETYPPEVTAILGATVLVITGILPVPDLLAVFSNPAPFTIGAMFVLSGALVRTGALDAVTASLATRAETHPVAVIAAFAVFVLVASAFMNNTPVVVMLLPVAVQLAGALNVSASKLLLPLSYTAILGGMLTLIGTSTNLLVDGVARQHGLAPFSLFEVSPVAAVIAVAGLGLMALAAPRLLPSRDALVDFLSRNKKLKFFTEVAIPQGSTLEGRPVLDVEHFSRNGMTVIDVLRGDASLRRNLGAVILAVGDRVVIRTGVTELLGLRENRSLTMSGQIDPLEQKSTVTVEALISPGCRMIGRLLGELRLRRRYGVYPLALHRREGRVGASLDEIRIRLGDTLLLEGSPEDINRLAEDMGLQTLTKPAERPYRRDRVPVVIGILGLVILGSAFGLMPIAGLALIGVAAALATRCIDAEEAFNLIEGRLLALIFAMLAIGSALQSTGAVALLVEAAAPFLMGLPPPLVLWLVFLMTSVLTELVSNNAVAVVVTPVAIGLALALGVDPRPFVVIVMVAASASFATPIGYQTNTLVYAPGGYRFTDYMRLGIPMNFGAGAIAALLVPLIWPL